MNTSFVPAFYDNFEDEQSVEEVLIEVNSAHSIAYDMVAVGLGIPESDKDFKMLVATYTNSYLLGKLIGNGKVEDN